MDMRYTGFCLGGPLDKTLLSHEAPRYVMNVLTGDFPEVADDDATVPGEAHPYVFVTLAPPDTMAGHVTDISGALPGFWLHAGCPIIEACALLASSYAGVPLPEVQNVGRMS